MIRQMMLLAGLAGPGVWAAEPYAAMAPAEHYRIASRDTEIALARSAAPTSISDDAEVLVMGAKGYETAVPGKNGFTCLVERSWGADFTDAEFWNPKLRGPHCFNKAGTHSILSIYLERTRWALAGVSRDDMRERTRKEVEAKEILPPESGAMVYMMSKDAYLSDKGGHWHPHLMFYVAKADESSWGANAKMSPVFGGPMSVEPYSLFIVQVPNWSDGSPVQMNH